MVLRPVVVVVVGGELAALRKLAVVRVEVEEHPIVEEVEGVEHLIVAGEGAVVHLTWEVEEGRTGVPEVMLQSGAAL